MDNILISEQAHCPGALMAGYASKHLQGEDAGGRAVRSRLFVSFKRHAVTIVVSGPVNDSQAQRFAVCWAAGDDRTKLTFAGELYVGRGVAPHSGSIVLAGNFLHAHTHGNRAAGSGRAIALAVGHALLTQLRQAIENAHGTRVINSGALAYALRYKN